MVSLRIFLLLALLGLAYGQIFNVDIGSMIVRSNGDNIAVSSTNRKSCYANQNVYYSDGSNILNSAGETLATAGGTIAGLACCCDMIAVTYTAVNEAGNQEIRVFIYKMVESGLQITVDRSLGEASPARAVITCNTEGRNFIAVSRTQVRLIPFDDLSQQGNEAPIAETVYTLATRLVAAPSCIAYRMAAANELDIFLSFGGSNDYAVIRIIDNEITLDGRYNLEINDDISSIYCIAYDMSNVYMVVTFRNNFPEADDAVYNVRSFPVTDVISGQAVTNGVTVTELMGSHELGASVNGLSVCGTDCQAFSCAAQTCGCTAPCGFCLFDSTVCQCAISNVGDACQYDDSINDQCIARLVKPDASLIIQNPLPMRRSGVVRVLGVMRQAGEVTVSRAVRIGRFSPTFYPRPVGSTALATVTGFSTNGFEATATHNVRPRLLGSRFGVFNGDFVPTDITQYQSVTISGLVTENSGWFNMLYTTTANQGDDVTLVTTTRQGSQAAPRVALFVWEFHRISQDPEEVFTPVIATQCSFPDDRRSCFLSNVAKATHEGIYEVTRRRSRQPRNWHPFFYLYVRSCPGNQWGNPCTNCPNACVHGHCDTESGECACYAGWMGNDCNTVCASPNTIGAACDINCSELGLPLATNCIGLQICRPCKLGCSCRSGLQSPECTQECAAGFYGENCLLPCPAVCANNLCDPRTGTCQ